MARPARAAGRRRAEYREDVRALRRAGARRPAAPCSRPSRSAIAWKRSSTSACRTSRWPSITRRRTTRPPTARCARPASRSRRSDAASTRVTAATAARTCSTHTVAGSSPRSLDRLYHDYNREDVGQRSRCTWCGRSPTRRTARSPASAPRRWRSGASPACSTRSTRCSRIMGPHPARFVRALRSGGAAPRAAARWCTAGRAATTSPRCSGSCGRCSSGPDRSSASSPRASSRATTDVGAGARQLLDAARWRSTSAAPTAACRSAPGVCYFFPRPSAGSACKRLNLFLRWMVRRDEVDLGVWTRGARRAADRAARHARHPARPLPAADALHQPGLEDGGRHHRVAARARSGDPVRFDFSLCHVGMMNACGFGRPQGDTQCPLKGLCRPRVRAVAG